MRGVKSGDDLQPDQLDGPHSCLCLGLVPFKLEWDFGRITSLCFRFFKVELVWKTPPGQFHCVTVMAEVLSTITLLQNLDMWWRGFVFYITPLQNPDVLKSLKKTIEIVCCNVSRNYGKFLSCCNTNKKMSLK
jgi:hypothetical protein